MIFSPAHVHFNNRYQRSMTYGAHDVSVKVTAVYSATNDGSGNDPNRSSISIAGYQYLTASASYAATHALFDVSGRG